MNRPNRSARKLLGIHYVEWVLVALVWIVLIHIVPSFLTTHYKAQESGLKVILKRLNEEQQQFYAQHGVFLDSSRNLTAAQPELQSPDRKYRFFNRRFKDKVFNYAVPKQEYEYGQYFVFPWNRFVGQKSWVGSVFVTDRAKKKTQTGICPIHDLNDEIVLTAAYGQFTCRAIQSSSLSKEGN